MYIPEYYKYVLKIFPGSLISVVFQLTSSFISLSFLCLVVNSSQGLSILLIFQGINSLFHSFSVVFHLSYFCSGFDNFFPPTFCFFFLAFLNHWGTFLKHLFEFLTLFIFHFKLCMTYGHVHVNMSVGFSRGQKRAVAPLGLEVPVVVSHLMWLLRTELRIFCKSSTCS